MSSVRSLPDTLQLLEQGEITSLDLSPWGSNYTFLAKVRDSSRECRAVYKPRDGEAPLWDFPGGTLYKREYAAYLLSEILGWEFIPTTVIRDGPYGIGSLQLFVDHDPRINYFTLRESNPDALRRIACFDLVTNNADRKASHCLMGLDHEVCSIDHGLTFHSATKLRTVIWDFSGEPVPEVLLNQLSGFAERMGQPDSTVRELTSLLDEEEAAALAHRVEWLLEKREYPAPAQPRYPYGF